MAIKRRQTDSPANELTAMTKYNPLGRGNYWSCTVMRTSVTSSSLSYLFHGYQKGASPLHWLP